MNMEDVDKANAASTRQIVGRRILQERISRGWSQSMLAEKMHTPILNISRWENGKTLPQPHHKEQLCIIFEKTIDELFGAQENVKLKEQDTLQLQKPSSQIPHSVEMLLPRDQNRQRMLEKVQTVWIKGLLEQSLRETPFVMPQLRESPDVVTSPWKRTLQDFHHPGHLFASQTSIEDIYIDAGRELLILGEPGSGKTTLLLELARILLQQAMQDETLPMPVLFNLASWAVRRQPIDRWLVEELSSKYQVPHKLGNVWVDNDLILPLLDGLDEVASQYRAACVEAINAYRQRRGLLPFVVCCRDAEYCSLVVSLHLQNAVVIQPQTAEQIDEYLAHMGEPLASVRQALHDDAELREVSATPLMLKVLVASYQGREATDLLREETQEGRRHRIFETYVWQMLHRRGTNRYEPSKTIQWLHWLACQLSNHTQNEFHIEYLQRDWLPDGPQRWLCPAFAVGLVYGLFFGIIKGASYVFMKGSDQYGRAFTFDRGIFDGLLIGLVNVLLFTLFNGVLFGVLYHWLTDHAVTPYGSKRRWLRMVSMLGSWPVYGLLNGVCNGLLISILIDPPAGIYNGLFVGLIYAGLNPLNPKIQPMEVLTWSWAPLGQHVMRYVGGGLLVGLGYGLLTGVYWQMKILPQMLGFHRFLPCLLFGLSIGCVLGLLIVVTRGLSATTLDEKNIPNQGMWNSARNSILAAIISWLIVGLFFGVIYGVVLEKTFHLFDITYREYGNFFPKQSSLSLGFTYGLVVGAFFWLRNGGTSCIQHVSLRLMLFRMKFIPWNYPDFLNEAAERLLLRRVGGGYIFFHPLLQEYFRTLKKPLDL